MIPLSHAGNKQGFTLIELMIVIVIIGILASVAYPAYQNSVKRSRRAVAQADLMSFANAMERRFSLQNTYENAAVGGADTGRPALTTFPSQTSPSDGGPEPYYELRIQAATRLTYTIAAEPIEDGPQENDGILTINQSGQRTWGNQPSWD